MITKTEFNEMDPIGKEMELRGPAQDVAMISLSTRVTWVRATLHKVDDIYFETISKGTYDKKGEIVTDETDFDPIAFDPADKPMEAWLHFMNMNPASLRALNK
jgi:hypothetical protein